MYTVSTNDDCTYLLCNNIVIAEFYFPGDAEQVAAALNEHERERQGEARQNVTQEGATLES